MTGRDAVLLVGDDRVLCVLQYMRWARVLRASDRDEATQLLDDNADSIETVIVSEDVPWASELRARLVGKLATIRFIRLPHGNQP